MASFLCPACQGVFSIDRQALHESLWCPARSSREGEEPAPLGSEDSGDEQSALGRGGKGRPLGGARAILSSLNQAIVVVEFGCWPGLHLTFEQEDIWGPACTGGALWYADRVMAEYLAFKRSSRSSDGLALVLGCGGVPLSGLVASAIGWDVLLTDLEIVLGQTRQNVRRNMEVLRLARAFGDGEDGVPEPRVFVRELPFGNDDLLEAAVLEASEPAAAADSPALILCSDCIWKPVLHEPLLRTIAAALRLAHGRASALVCFQSRNKGVEAQFMARLKDPESGLNHTPVDLHEVLPQVKWPQQVEGAAAQYRLEEEFSLLEITLQDG